MDCVTAGHCSELSTAFGFSCCLWHLIVSTEGFMAASLKHLLCFPYQTAKQTGVLWWPPPHSSMNIPPLALLPSSVWVWQCCEGLWIPAELLLLQLSPALFPCWGGLSARGRLGFNQAFPFPVCTLLHFPIKW